MKTVFVCAMFFIVQLLPHSNTGAPQKPKNISCKIFDFIKMVCTWDPLHSSPRTKWSLRYGNQCHRKCISPGPITNLPLMHFEPRKLNQNQEKIVIWDKDSASPYRLYCEKCLQIIGIYKTGTIKSDIIKFMSEYIVELSPVNIKKIKMTDSSIYIKWKHPLIRRPTVCNVRYAPDHLPLHNKTKWNNNTDIHLTELLPSTLYILWIKWKLKTSTFWSKEKGLNVTTNHAALKSGPVITQRGYLKHKCLLSNQTCLSIYWKPIQGSLARTNFYEISCCMLHENVHRNAKRVDAKKCSLVMKYPDFPIKSICIRANTDVGFSPYSTFILNQDESAPPKARTVTVKETKDPQTLLLTWSYEPRYYSKAQVINVTLLWCHGKKAFTDVLVVHCEDHIDWITVVANGSYLLRLTKAIDIHHFHVAVILNSKAGSQGMTWSECIFTQTGYIRDLQVSLLITTFSEKILVQWYPVECKITIIPLMYQVAYTRQTEKHQQNPCESGSLVNVSISHTNVELKNLATNEFYYICMRLITVIGPTPFSKPYLEKTNALSTKARTFEPRVYSVDISTTQREHQILKNEEGISQTTTFVTCIIAGIFSLIIFLRYLWKYCYFTIKIDIPEIIPMNEEYPMNEESSNEKAAPKQGKEKWMPDKI